MMQVFRYVVCAAIALITSSCEVATEAVVEKR
jgi:hypothetical protein